MILDKNNFNLTMSDANYSEVRKSISDISELGPEIGIPA